MSSINYMLSRECCSLGIQADVSDIEQLTSWQKQRLQAYLKLGHRTIPRVLYPLCETPDLRLPWIEDLVHDVEDCLRHSGVDLSRSLATKIRQRDSLAVDQLVVQYWMAMQAGEAEHVDIILDIESLPPRGKASQADPVDDLALTEVHIPPEVGNAVKIFEQIEALNQNINLFLSAIAAISLQPDLRPIDSVFQSDEMISILRKNGIFRVCDLIASVVTGSIHQATGMKKKQRDSAIMKAAEIQRNCFDSIRNSMIKNPRSGADSSVQPY